MAPGDMQEDLKNNIDSSLLWLLSPQGVYRYLDRIMRKRKNGQPVSFTDFFGHMVGETLIKDVSRKYIFVCVLFLMQGSCVGMW